MADDRMPRVLFVTRKFPPSTGGMETLADETWRALRELPITAELVAYGGPNAGLPRWLPGAYRRVLKALRADQVDRLVVGDALMTALLQPVLRLVPAARRPPLVSMVMGLDLTWGLPGYRTAVRAALRRSQRVCGISSATAAAAVALGVEAARVTVLPLGVDVAEVPIAKRRDARAQLCRGRPLGTRLVVTVGRLVERKGVAWFVAYVLPQLPAEVHYLVAGTGNHEAAIQAAARTADVADRVHLLGHVDEVTRDQLMAGADLFVQPNVPVAGDLEGFGLVVVEAAGRGTPVVAARLEGVQDAVIDGETGELVAPGDAAAWRDAVRRLLALPPDELDDLGATRGAATRRVYSRARMAAGLAGALGLGATDGR